MMIQSKFNHFSNIMYKWILSYMLHACRMGFLVQGHITGFHYQHSQHYKVLLVANIFDFL